MPSKKSNTDPFVSRVVSALEKADNTLIYPGLRVKCAKTLGSYKLEEDIYVFCNGGHNEYVPAVQFAIANKGHDGDLIDLYTTTINSDANAATHYVDPVDTAVNTINSMKFVTKVEGCNKNAKRCPSCHRTEDVSPYQRQTRSADEGTTAFFECVYPKCPRRGAPFK